ncbi:MAG: hypothetical protein IKP72_17230 [Clostridia bacterium]|nr:hypothetical protein [Clostridia bacterium]
MTFKDVAMEYKDIFDRAKAVIGEENILDYRPAVMEFAPDTFIRGQHLIPDTIMIWLKNGDCIMYRYVERENRR